MNVISPSRNPHNVTRDFLPTIYETLYNFNASYQFLLSLCVFTKSRVEFWGMVDIFKESSGFGSYTSWKDKITFCSGLYLFSTLYCVHSVHYFIYHRFNKNEIFIFHYHYKRDSEHGLREMREQKDVVEETKKIQTKVFMMTAN